MNAGICSKYSQQHINIQNKTKISNFLILFFTMLILIFGCASNKKQADPVKNKIENEIDKGFDLCNQALKIYQQDNLKAPEALLKLNEGIEKICKELDSHRNPEGNLPKEMAGVDAKLFTWLGFRKTLREQSYIINARKEKVKNK